VDDMPTTQKNTENQVAKHTEKGMKKILSNLILGQVAGPSLLVTTLAVSYFTKMEFVTALMATYGTVLAGTLVVGTCQRLQNTSQRYVDDFRGDIIKKVGAAVDAQKDKAKVAEIKSSKRRQTPCQRYVDDFREDAIKQALAQVGDAQKNKAGVIGASQRRQNPCQRYVNDFRQDIIKKAVARAEDAQKDKAKRAEWIKMVNKTQAAQTSLQLASTTKTLAPSVGTVIFRQLNTVPLIPLSELPKLAGEPPRYPTRVRNKPKYFGS
jgi:hypothetical protein